MPNSIATGSTFLPPKKPLMISFCSAVRIRKTELNRVVIPYGCPSMPFRQRFLVQTSRAAPKKANLSVWYLDRYNIDLQDPGSVWEIRVSPRTERIRTLPWLDLQRQTRWVGINSNNFWNISEGWCFPTGTCWCFDHRYRNGKGNYHLHHSRFRCQRCYHLQHEHENNYHQALRVNKGEEPNQISCFVPYC